MITVKTLQTITIRSLALMLMVTAGVAHAGKLYKWVDADGNISYQDSPPPSDAKVLEESNLTTTSTGQPSANLSVAPLVVYTLEDCDSCELLMVRLRQLDLPFVEQSLLDRDIQSEILTENDALTAPTMKIGDQFINQFKEPAFIALLRQAGYKPKFDSSNRSNSPTDDGAQDDSSQ